MLNATACTLAGLMLMCGATAPASGQPVIIYDFLDAYAGIAQADQNFNFVGTPQNVDNIGMSGFDFLGSAAATYNDMGFVGMCSSNWHHAYTPGNPGPGNAFSGASMGGSATSNSTSGGLWHDVNSSGGNSTIAFSVGSDTPWAFKANIAGTSSGSGTAVYFAFVGDFATYDVQATRSASGGDSLNDSVNIGGVVPAGAYYFDCSVAAYQEYQFTPGSGSASIEVSNGVLTIPAPLNAFTAWSTGSTITTHSTPINGPTATGSALALPAAPPGTPGTTNITHGGTYASGSYGALNVPDGSVLNFSAGTYVFSSWAAKDNCTFNFDTTNGCVQIVVTGDAAFHDRNVLNNNGLSPVRFHITDGDLKVHDSMTATNLDFVVHNGKATFHDDSHCWMGVYASGKITFHDGGAIWPNSVVNCF